jgi:hypothetical protein
MLCHLLSLVIASTISAPPKVTIESLLGEMDDPDALARYPLPSFRQLQASSYDRSETDPQNAQTWFGNQDYGQFIRTEPHGARTELVIMDQTGPGAVTRIWTPLLADKDHMIVRFYLDGSDKPTIEEKFNDLLRGNGPIKPPFAYIAWPDPSVTSGVGADLYYPIPFARSCKITLSEVPFYYSIDYRSYPPGTRVETFTWDAFHNLINRSARVGQSLLLSKSVSGPLGSSARSTLQPGQSITQKLPKGAHELSELMLDVPTNLDSQALRSLIVRMTFDGEQTVWCPLGEFFGCGIHLKPVQDRYRRVSDGRLESRWPMPYAKTAEVSIQNLGIAPIPVKIQTLTKPWKWDDRSLHFHATWRYQFPLATRPMSDWNYVEASGKGVYVGDTLTVMNPSPAWYGEGDERVYVDGEKFPSQLGTGTEDYYGYAWGMDEHWSSAFMSMPERDRKGRDNWLGYTTTSRVRGLDSIPFERSLKFDMEIWHWADCKEAYSAATFWYARPHATSNRPPSPLDAIRALPDAGGVVKGAFECETMKVAKQSPGVQMSTQTGGLSEGYWSDGAQLFVQAHQVGDFVELRVPLQQSGSRHLTLYATKSYDYGVVKFSVNGRPLKTVDLWSAKPIASGPIDLGVVDLHGKSAILRAELVGTNPHSTGDRYYFGLDCLLIK